MTDSRITIYTDGACRGNPGPGGWGAIIRLGDAEKVIAGGEKLTTNNRMELKAAVSALSLLTTHARIDLYSDSKYLVNGLALGWAENWKSRGWKRSDGKPALNSDLWEKLLELNARHKITLHWVEGHAGNPDNERCDRLATGYADAFAE